MSQSGRAKARRVTERLIERMHEREGLVSRAVERAGVGRNYFSQAAERGSLDLAVFFSALEALDIHPTRFMEEVVGPWDTVEELGKEYGSRSEEE